MKSKKFISMLLVLTMVFSYVSLAQLTEIDLASWLIKATAAEEVQTGTCGDNLTWTLNCSTGELVITGNGESISSNAFENNETIKKITFPDSVKEIGKKAFYQCNKIEEVSFPSSIKEIGINAFASCASLKKIDFNEPLTNELIIDQAAFHYCYNLEEVNLPEGLTTLGINAFSNCSSLESIVIPASVTSLGGYCFFECGALETVEFKENSQLLTVGSPNSYGPFARCYSLKNITLPQSVETIEFGAFSGCASLESFNIPKNVNRIDAPVAFDAGTSAGSLVSLKNISVDPENEMFFLDENGSLCSSTKSGTVYLLAAPDKKDLKTLKINEYSKIDCYRYITDIETIEVAENVTSYTVDEHGVLFNSDMTTLLKYPAGNPAEEYIIPASVTSISFHAFWGAENLKSFAVEEGNTRYTAVDGVLYNIDKTEIIEYPIGKTASEFKILPSAKIINPESLINAKHIKKYSVSSENEYFVSDEDGVLYKKNKNHKILYLFPNGINAVEYTVPDDVTIINIDALYETDIEELTIPKSVLSIGTTNPYDILVKKISTINYEGNSLFEDVENATRLLAVSTVNNSVEKSPSEEDGGLNTGSDSATRITYSYEKGENGTFDYNGKIDFEVIAKAKTDYEDAFRGYADESDDIFFYKIKFYALDENDNRKGEIQPVNGKKVKIGFPIPAGYETANSNLFMVLHKRSDNNKLEFFKPSNNNIEVKDGYIYIWTDNFSPFALVVNYNENASIVSSISIASLPSKTAYTYKTDSLDLSGLALTVTYSDGSTETITDTSKMKVSGFDNKKVGTQTVTVEYEDITATFDVTVSYAWWQWIIRILLLGFLWY